MTKVIYLDIDGVLNSGEDFTNLCNGSDNVSYKTRCFINQGNYVEYYKLQILHRIIKECNASVVIVSSWANVLQTGEYICSCLELPYHSEAYYTGGGEYRGMGIQRHVHDYDLIDSDYIIIDDSQRMYYSKERLITIDGRYGITTSDEKRIINKLRV